jgi:hypothetical protein
MLQRSFGVTNGPIAFGDSLTNEMSVLNDSPFNGCETPSCAAAAMRSKQGEQQNVLRRAVFFNRLGEVRDRSYENQSQRASGSNLLLR